MRSPCDLHCRHGRHAPDHRRDRPAHALGPRVVLAVPDVPHAAREAARRAAAAARDRPRRTRGSCSTGRPRSSTTTSRCDPRWPDTLRRLSASGRISLGPWMVQMDEFMVSGETMVRDLQFGLAQAAQYGGAMPVGYLPDIFGHIAQMPQLLRLVGIDHAVAWRGIPASVDKTAFWWDAPDGSRVRCEYLYGSYSNGRDIPEDAKGLVLRAVDYATGARRRAARRHVVDERHRPPDAATVARAGRRRSERHAGRLPLRRHVAAGVPAAAADRRAPDGRRRAALRRARQPAHGRRVEPRRRAPGVRGRRARARTAGRADGRPVPAGRAVPARVLRRRVAQLGAQQRARLVVRVQSRRSRRSRRRPLPGSAPDRRRVGARRVARACERGRRGTDVDDRREPHCPRAIGHRRRHCFPATDRATSSPPTAPRCPTQLLGVITGEGYKTMVTGQKVRWVLDLMRGTEFAGRQIASYDVVEGAEFHDIVLQEAGPLDTRCDLSELKAHMLALGEDDTTMRLRVLVTPLRRSPVRHRIRSTGSAGPRSPVWTASRPPARSSRPMPRSGTSTSASRSTPRTVPTRSRRTTVFASAASVAWSTAATAATRTTTRRRPKT